MPMNWRLWILTGLLITTTFAAEKAAPDDGWAARRKALSEEATTAFAEQDWQQARHLYGQILEREPDNAVILANLGAIEYQLGDYKACCDLLESALAKQATLFSSREMLGMAYYLDKQPMRALAALARAAADQPTSPRVHNQLAVVLQAMTWYDGAEKSLLQAIALDPDYRDAHYNLALIYLDRESPSPERARKHYEKALQLGTSPDANLEKRL